MTVSTEPPSARIQGLVGSRDDMDRIPGRWLGTARHGGAWRQPVRRDGELLWWNDSLQGAAIAELEIDEGTDEISIAGFQWVGRPGEGWAFDRVFDIDLDGIDEILWYHAGFDGYAVQVFDDGVPGATVWLGNIGTDNWTATHFDEFVL